MQTTIQTTQALTLSPTGNFYKKPNSSREFKGLEKVFVDSLEEFEPVWDIMVKEFPPCELRTKDAQFDLLKKSKYNLAAFKNSTLETVAFLSYWEFDEFCFLEHFAVKKAFQSFGYGSMILKEFVHDHKKIVLEVEDPLYSNDPTICDKRIKFYNRLGFQVQEEMSFVQPALKPNDENLPHLLLMTLKPLSVNFVQIFTLLKQFVY